MAVAPAPYRRFLVRDGMLAFNRTLRRIMEDDTRVRSGRFMDPDQIRDYLQDLFERINGSEDPWLAGRVADLIRRANGPEVTGPSKWLFDQMLVIEDDHHNLLRREMDLHVRRDRGGSMELTPSPPVPQLSDDPIHLRIPDTPQPVPPEEEEMEDSLDDITSPEDEEEEGEEKMASDAEEVPSQVEDDEWADIAATVALQMAQLTSAGASWGAELIRLRNVLVEQRRRIHALAESHPRQITGLISLETALDAIRDFLPADPRYNPLDLERLRMFLRNLIDAAATEEQRMALWARIRPHVDRFQ